MSRTERPAHASHAVQFYADEEFLADTVAAFLGDGLVAGEPVVVIATEAHRQAFCERLRARPIDVARVCASGQLTLLDARATLDTLMVDGEPSLERFGEHVVTMLERVTAGRKQPLIWAYGEMVDLLWREGRADAAIRLEALWNELAREQPMRLLCGYDLDGFFRVGDNESFARVCGLHSHASPGEHGSAARLRQLVDKEANRAKDEFLAMLGHELRNPLAPIVTALELMKLRGDVSSGKEQVIIERQVQYVVRLVDDLLDVSRITQGKIELKKETFELATVVANAVETASPLLEQRRHRLSIDVARRGLRLNGDVARISQVLVNLLTNAAKYTDCEGRIELGAWRDGHEIVVQVKDNGVGIRAELLPRLFELFVQGPRAADRSEGGLGIGLTLVRSLVQMHGGTVVALSDGPGKGSAFVVRLPAATATAADAVTPATPPVGRTSAPRRVLIVDDNIDGAVLLAELCGAMGHDVRVAHDGPQALTAIQEHAPDVAVLDIGLPVMDGYELARRVREQLGPRCRLIALTGYGQEHDRTRSAQAGFDAHLVKPVDPQHVLALIDEAAPLE